MRCFVSLNINNKNKELIHKTQNELKNRIDKPFLVRYENPNNFHLTLFFIGEIDETKLKEVSEDLRMAIENKFGELNFIFSHIEGFPDLKKPKVLFLNCVNPENKIFNLAESIKNTLLEYGYTPDKDFHPHITLGRVKGRIKLNDISNMDIDLKFSVNRVSIMQSKLTTSGAEHKEIFAINL